MNIGPFYDLLDFFQNFASWLSSFLETYIFGQDVGILALYPFFILFVILVLTGVISKLVGAFFGAE